MKRKSDKFDSVDSIDSPEHAYEWMIKYATKNQLCELFPWYPHRKQMLAKLHKNDAMKKPAFVSRVQFWWKEYHLNQSTRLRMMRIYHTRRENWLMLANNIQVGQQIQVEVLPYAFRSHKNAQIHKNYAYHRSKSIRALITKCHFPRPKQKFQESWVVHIETQQWVEVECRKHTQDEEEEEQLEMETICVPLHTMIQIHVSVDVKTAQDYEMKGYVENKKIRIVWNLWDWFSCQCLHQYLPVDLARIVSGLLIEDLWTTG